MSYLSIVAVVLGLYAVWLTWRIARYCDEEAEAARTGRKGESMKIELRAERNDDGTWKAETLVEGHVWSRGVDLDEQGVTGLVNDAISAAPALSWCVNSGAWSFDAALVQGGADERLHM